jgi:malonate-semialdehyde dehydrogenase (acetylating) / methylmalonate-semialdehyde dehydrogenase
MSTDIHTCPNFINGEWSVPDVSAYNPVYNPSTGEQIAQAPMSGPAIVEQAVAAARDAAEGWWQTPPVERIRVLFRYKMLLEDHFEELAACVTREHGKTLQEARGDVRRGVEVVEYACAITELLKGECLENIARGIDCELQRQPVGICAGICPYNFPALVPMWMYPLAIACGNTFILKPSEKVPLTSVRLIELLQQAGLPKGVLNLVHGGRESVDAILTHPDIKAISFVGSSPVAQYIFEQGTRHGKRVQAAGGAKNFVVVMPDAEIPKVVDGMVDSAFGCAGQRCMAGSTAITVGKAADLFLPEMADAARAIRVGPTDRTPAGQLGAVISPEHRNRIEQLIAGGVQEGADAIVDGRTVKVADFPNGFYLGPTILDQVRPEMKVHQDEVFGPVLNVIRAEDLAQALEIANTCSFGNGCCIYTRSGQVAREFKHRVKAGMVGINVGIPAPMAYFPFSGWDYSFFGDLHIQGREAIQFYTRAKVTTTRWFSQGEGDIWHKDRS